MKKPYCLAPWIHACANANGARMLCCTSQESKLINYSLRDFHNSEYMKSIRVQMLKGEMPDHCDQSCAETSTSVYKYKDHFNNMFNNSDVATIIANTSDNG